MTHRDVASRPPADLCREAIGLLDSALQKPPVELKSEVDDAERAVVRLRDELIERWRSEPQEPTGRALEQVNVALSLIVGLEYPMGGIERKLLEDAHHALQSALDAGAFSRE